MTDLVFEPIPHAAIHTRPDIWYLNEGHLFLIEVAVAGDTLRRQTEIALAKRATYAPLLAHIRAHSGWTTYVPDRTYALVFGLRGRDRLASASAIQ